MVWEFTKYIVDINEDELAGRKVESKKIRRESQGTLPLSVRVWGSAVDLWVTTQIIPEFTKKKL